MLLRFLVLVIFAQAIFGCNTRKSQHSDSVITKAYKMIDEGREKEAIALLQDELKGNDKNDEIKVALASAYVSLAGLKVEAFSKVALSVMDKSESTQMPEQYLNPAIDEGLKKMAKGAVELIRTLVVFKNIPNIDEAHNKYLEQAIKLMSDVNNLDKGRALYKAVLESVQFKHELIYNLIPSIFVKKDDICRVNFNNSAQAVKKSLKHLKVIADLPPV